MRPTVDKVESSIKGGVKAKLGRKTLILGANGLGKSAIVNAVELAGTGKASDVAGRSVLAKDADLFMLAPPGKDHVSARAYLSEGAGTAAWELRKGHRAKRTGPEVHFPLRDVQEALLGSAETARKWVLQHGTPFSWSDVIMLVPLSLQPKLASLGRGPDPASSLTTALERARTEVRTANASAKTLRSLSSPSQPPPDPVFIAELEGIISAWQLRGNAAGPDDSAVQILKEALETRRTQISSLEGRVNEIEAKLASLPKPQGNFEVLRSAITVVETIAAGHFARCPICEGKVDLEAMKAKCISGKAKVKALLAQAEEWNATVKDRESSLSELRMARRGADTLATEFARAEKTVKKDDSPVPAMSLEAAQEKLRSLMSIRAGWDASQRAEERALAAESDAHEWSQLADALSKALGVLVEKARAGFVSKVQRFLPTSDVFGVELLDGEREVLRVGLLRESGGRTADVMGPPARALHAALSGAEWARVTAALALAVAPTTAPCVVCPEERAFDPDTLTSVLEAFGAALEGSDGPQVIVTSPNPPREVPAGWTVVDLGGVDQVEEAKSKPSAPPPAKGRPKDRPASNEPAVAANEPQQQPKLSAADLSALFE
ncbi:MAG TPA: hypothetical protein VJH87_03575 [Vicinamibacteria bacterium]|nr:hypothetical protein [Vicinamibacteria bacterium]